LLPLFFRDDYLLLGRFGFRYQPRDELASAASLFICVTIFKDAVLGNSLQSDGLAQTNTARRERGTRRSFLVAKIRGVAEPIVPPQQTDAGN
jgi:hypothetical protein